MARLRRSSVKAVLAGACVCCIACSGGAGPGPSGGGGGGGSGDTAIDSAGSTLTVPSNVEMQGEAAIVPISVQARNTAGEPLAGVAVELTASGTAGTVTIVPASGVSDSAGTFSATMNAATWGTFTVAATLGREARLAADVEVTCPPRPFTWPAQLSPTETDVQPTRLRSVADGRTPIRLLVTADFLASGMGQTFTFSLSDVCFRASADRTDVVLDPATGRTPHTYGSGEVLVTSSTAGPASITVETPFGSKTVQVEFVSRSAWMRLPSSDPAAPIDARAIAVVPGGRQLIAFSDGRLVASADAGATWRASNAPTFSPTQNAEWMDASAWFDLIASPSVPGVVMGLSRFSGGDAVASVDGGLNFTTVSAGSAGIRVHPVTGEWLVWPTSPGAPLLGDGYARGWRPGTFFLSESETWRFGEVSLLYLARTNASAWLAIAWDPFAYAGEPLASPRLWSIDPTGAWSDVTAALFSGSVPSLYEYLSWKIDAASALDDPSLVFLSTSRGLKLGPSVYGATWAGAWTSTDAGATWAPMTPWSGRMFASASTGVFRIDSNGIVWKRAEGGELDASLGLPDHVRTLSFDPSRPGVVYAATPSGLYLTTTGGQ